MNYIIFDLEWNQAPNADAVVTEPVCIEGEIIELGAVKLNEEFKVVDEFCMFVLPKFYKKMHNRISALTGIRDKDLTEKGVPFPEMYEKFLAWCGEEYTFMTWSLSDLPVLIDNMLVHGMDVSHFPECCDIQRIFSREIMRNNTRYSLDTALETLSERGEAAHDALHDARNTAKVCDHLDLEQYLTEYTSRIFPEKPNGTVYENRKQAAEDPALQQFVCPWCGQPLSCEPWLYYRGNTLWSYGICPEEDEFLVELSVEQRPDGTYSAKRLVFEMSDDLWDIYMEKKEALGV